MHTPGPWKATRSHEDFNGPLWDIAADQREEYALRPIVSIESATRTVVTCHDLGTISDDDARLIAQAPDLLACLRECALRLTLIVESERGGKLLDTLALYKANELLSKHPRDD